jgi:carbamoyltransferase
LRPTDVDAVGLGAWVGADSWTTFPDYLREAMERGAESADVRTAIMSRVNGSIASDRRQIADLEDGLHCIGLAEKPRFQCGHHHAHAVTAFEFSPFERALVVTLDGRGDFLSGSVSVWQRGGATALLRQELELDSLGAFYGWITRYLGFTPDRHEGKVTGLAAHGNSDACAAILQRSIGTEDGRIRANVGPCYAPFMRADLPELAAALAPYSREDVAAGAQSVLERVAVSYVSHYLEKSGESNLCLAGGIFANVLLNQRLKNLPGVERLFIFPHMGDGGISAGGAAFATRQRGISIEPLRSVYLGPEFDDAQCRTVIESAGCVFEQPNDLADVVAHELDAGAVVGVFQGRMEYGPRALGNRSILARATDASINYSLNKRLNRSEFMPFAPVTLREHASRCYSDWRRDDLPAIYMTSCYACAPWMREVSPAVVHVDGSARPQVISREDNPFYYDVLTAYERLSGIPSIVNTSFNEHEAPIVCTPAQAVEALRRDAIDLLAMPPYLVRSNHRA